MWSDAWATLTRRAAYKKYERDFVPSTVEASDPGFTPNEIVVLASEFLDAWQHGRWGLVAKFTPPCCADPNPTGRLPAMQGPSSNGTN